MKEMKTVCFQAKQYNGMVHRIDVKFQVVPTSCTSQLSFEVSYYLISILHISFINSKNLNMVIIFDEFINLKL